MGYVVFYLLLIRFSSLYRLGYTLNFALRTIGKGGTMDTLNDIPTEIQEVTTSGGNLVVHEQFFKIVGHTYGANHLLILQDELPCGDFKLDDPDGNR